MNQQPAGGLTGQMGWLGLGVSSHQPVCIHHYCCCPRYHDLPTTSVVQAEQLVQCLCVCLCIWKITFQLNAPWPRSSACWLISTLYRSSSKVKVIAQSSRSNEVKCCQSGRYDLKQGLSSYNYYFIPSGFIPCSRHLLYRQAWHAFRLFRVISHWPLAGHTYSMCPAHCHNIHDVVY